MSANDLPRRPQSTGPRTPQGKARAGRNARRHGLALPIRTDPRWHARVVALERRQLANEGPGHFARMTAEAVVELARIARARAELIDGLDGAERIEALRKLDTYERYAYAKKRKAFRLLACHRFFHARTRQQHLLRQGTI